MVTLARGRDGALWIGYFQAGISQFARGQLHNYGRDQGVPVGVVPHFSQDRDGRLWAAINGGLRQFDGQRWQPLPAGTGVPEHRVQWVLHDSRGTFWVLADLKIWMRGRPGGVRGHRHRRLADGDAGRKPAGRSVAGRPRARHLAAGQRAGPAAGQRTRSATPAGLVAARLQFTADGALWATMSPHGGVARVTFDGTAPCAWSASIRRTG
jgi:hypothetical protein